jgi:DNA ligase (NAD+)
MGETIAASVAEFFNDEKNIKTLEKLKEMGIELTNPDYEKGTKKKRALEGLTFVITGTLPVPRAEAEDFIEKNGGHSASSVSKKTDYVVLGENPGSKAEKARELGVKTVSYDELLELVK